MNGYIDVSRVTVREINKNVAKDIIVKNHYTHKWSLCRVAYGVFYKSNEMESFIDSEKEQLIGCVVYGQPVGRSAAASICPLIKVGEVLELTRLWISDIKNGKNMESYVISNSIKLIKKNFPEIKCILSYADGEQSHRGTIYQACNFLYQGNSSIALMPNYSISETGPDEGYKWMHSRTAFSKYGSHNVEHLKKVIGKTFYRKRESAKHRYILFISDKMNNKRFKNTLKHPILPYPKETSHTEEIEKIEVFESKESNTFFE